MKSRVILAILFIVPMIPPSTVMSSYYVGNHYVSAYGGRVNIYTPPYPINVFHYGQFHYGQSNWISLPLPYWIQTGWRYYSGYQFPEKYVEYYSPVSNYEIYPQGNQNWGTMIEYKIINVGDEVWCAYIKQSWDRMQRHSLCSFCIADDVRSSQRSLNRVAYTIRRSILSRFEW